MEYSHVVTAETCKNALCCFFSVIRRELLFCIMIVLLLTIFRIFKMKITYNSTLVLWWSPSKLVTLLYTVFLNGLDENWCFAINFDINCFAINYLTYFWKWKLLITQSALVVTFDTCNNALYCFPSLIRRELVFCRMVILILIVLRILKNKN